MEGDKIATLEHVLETAPKREAVDSVSGLLYDIEEYARAQISNTDVSLVIDIIPENNGYIKGIYHIEHDGMDIYRKGDSKEITLDTEEEVLLAQELTNGLVMKELPLTTKEKILRTIFLGFYPPKKEIDKKVNVFTIREAIREAHDECAKHYNLSLD